MFCAMSHFWENLCTMPEAKNTWQWCHILVAWRDPMASSCCLRRSGLAALLFSLSHGTDRWVALSTYGLPQYYNMKIGTTLWRRASAVTSGARRPREWLDPSCCLRRSGTSRDPRSQSPAGALSRPWSAAAGALGEVSGASRRHLRVCSWPSRSCFFGRRGIAAPRRTFSLHREELFRLAKCSAYALHVPLRCAGSLLLRCRALRTLT